MAKGKKVDTSFNFGFNVKGAKKPGGKKSTAKGAKGGNAWRRYTAGGKGGAF